MPDGITLNAHALAARFVSDMGRFAQRLQTEGGRVVRDQMTTTRQVIVQTTPVDTGNLQTHWGPVQERSTGQLLVYGVENPVEYGPLLEYGGYRGVGPRTTRLGGGDLGGGFVAGGGIYSTQAPLGFVRKALVGAWPQFQRRLWHMVRQAWPYAVVSAPAVTRPGGAEGGLTYQLMQQMRLQKQVMQRARRRRRRG